ncbi:MAG: hypothetical protein N2653_04640 [Burkholderiales bacterium]|nr:hypothetical protein [Burkholderiales bacterium]
MRAIARSVVAFSAALAGCASVPPTGPSVLVLPGSGKTFEEFRADEAECHRYASERAGASPAQASRDSAITSAALGTAVGAAAGALIGGRDAAGLGAGAGLVAGTLAGANAASDAARALQQRYDIGYRQCMYAKGHRVPVAGRLEPRRARIPPPPPAPG